MVCVSWCVSVKIVFLGSSQKEVGALHGRVPQSLAQRQMRTEAAMMPEHLPWFPFFPEKWISSDDIALMSIAEEGAYHRLLCREWMEPDCGLPDDDSKLAILSKLGRGWVKSAPLIRSKFTPRDGRLFNEKLLGIWREQQAKSQKAKTNGERGGRPPNKPDGSVLETGRLSNQKPRETGSEPEGSLRASSSRSSSVSREVKAEEQQSADGPKEATVDEWAQAATAMRSFFPVLDDPFVIDVCFLCIRENNEVTDGQIAEAVYATYTTAQKSPGLFRTTVPNYIRARKRGIPIKPKSGMDAELERLQSIEKADKEATNGRQ